MKFIKSKAICIVLIAFVFNSCTKDTDVEYPVLKQILLAENFGVSGDNNAILPLPTDWTSYAEVGTKLWYSSIYKGDGYAKFTAFQSGEPTNVSWLISPAINMDNKENVKLTFQTSHDKFVTSTANSLDLFISTDYDGTNFTSAHWTKTNYTTTQTYPLTDAYAYVNSGFVDLSAYNKGVIHLAFKYSGSSSLSGSYQVDNVRVFY
jgi:hypothetical protein